MKINLRKANALQLAINQAINEKPVKFTVSIGRFDDPKKKWIEANTEMNRLLDRKGDLYLALYAVREAIAAANVNAGVSGKLAEMAHTDKAIESYKTMAAITDFSPSDETLLKQWEDLVAEENSPTSYVRRRDAIEVSLVSKVLVDEWNATLAEARLEKQRLSDEILELNVKTEIEIPTEHVEVLKANKLL